MKLKCVTVLLMAASLAATSYASDISKAARSGDLEALQNLVVQGADVRVVQCRRSSGFALESFQDLGLACEILAQELERDMSSEAQVLRLVDDTHAPTAELLQDPVVRYLLTDHHGLFPVLRRVLGSLHPRH